MMNSLNKSRMEMEVGADGIAVITIINPPLNSLSPYLLSSLRRSYDEALGRADVKAIVVTAKNPSVAAIDGLAVGGGLEVMACHAWISTSGPQLGFFELLIGILPVFGGTQRPPQLVGLSNSKGLEMMLTSRPVIGEVDHSLALFYATFYLRTLVFVKSKREEGIVYGPGAGLWKQVATFERLLHHSDTWKNLVHIFFAQRGLTRNQEKSRL